MAGPTTGHLLLLLGLCCTLVQASYPLKILGLFPHPGISHFHFFHPIMRGLSEKGHDVTVLSHFPDKSPPARYRDLLLTRHETLTNSVDLKFFETQHFYDHFGVFFLLHEWAKDACNLTLRSDALAQVLRQRQHFDVIIMEQFNSDCMTAVAHQLKAPFIGLSSSEAVYCGVPVVVTPMYGDQFVNAAALKYRGMGVVLKYDDITENSVLRSIREVLKKQYVDNAKAVSFSYRHRPQSALETAIWWVEYVAKTEGAPLLKAHAVQVSRFVYYSLDIYLFIAAIIFISVVSWSFICSRWCSRRPKASKQKSN